MRTQLLIIGLIIPLFCLTQVSFAQDPSDQLVQAIRENRIEEVVRLVKNGANVNELTKIGISPLVQAVLGKKIEIVKLLVENGADVNLNTPRFGCGCKNKSKRIFGLDCSNVCHNAWRC